MTRAKVFKSGNSQAVRLPKEFRFETKEVEIFRQGNDVVLRSSRTDLTELFEILGTLSDDFMKGGRKQPMPQVRENF